MTGWSCTYGNSPNDAICNEICGDGLIVGSEVCDDGSQNGEGCNSSCSGPESGWSCSYGNFPFDAVCSEICGDGLKVGSEICDDGS